MANIFFQLDMTIAFGYGHYNKRESLICFMNFLEMYEYSIQSEPIFYKHIEFYGKKNIQL
jgi:hypothetical protein